MDRYISRRCLISCIRLVFQDPSWNGHGWSFPCTFTSFFISFDCKMFAQADWKPVSPDRFGDIAALIKSIDLLKVEETKPQGLVSCLLFWHFVDFVSVLWIFEWKNLDNLPGERSKSSQTSAKSAPSNPPAQKPAAYRPPHAKNAAVVQAEVCLVYIFLFLNNCKTPYWSNWPSC